MKLVEKIAGELGIAHKLHLWPDPELLEAKVINAQPDPEGFRLWLRLWHGRISEWPGKNGAGAYFPYPVPDATAKDASTPLSASDKKALVKALVKALANVRALRKSQYKAGKALQLIVEKKLYRPISFQQFCHMQFGFSRQYAYYLIDFAVFTDSLSTAVDTSRLPTCEAHARPIISAFRDDVERRRKAWLRACELASGDVPGSDEVNAALDEMRDPAQPKGNPPEETLQPETESMHRIFDILGELEGAVKASRHRKLQRLVDQLKTELRQVFTEAA